MDDLWYLFLQDRKEITVPLGFVIAVLVTAHVLLRKRETASAAGWIGLAWFAPITGAITYLMFGVNRVRRRARKLRPDNRKLEGRPEDATEAEAELHLEPLQRGIRRLTGRPVVAGNDVCIYQDGDHAYPRMLSAIAEATSSVGLSSYIFHNDKWGGKFIDALTAAQARGVAVRVLIDGIGGGWLRSAAYHRLRRKGVPAARFLHSPLPWRMPFLNLRSHRKILVVDGTIGFTGGMNIGDENVRSEHSKNPVQDTHFRFEGPVVCQLVEAFTQDWSFASDEDLDGPTWFPQVPPQGSAPARVVASGPDEDIEKIEFAMLQAVACARESISIMTPYFLPDNRLVTALSLAAMRGVSVNVVVPQKSDHRLVDWAMRADVGPLLSDGVKIWRCPPPFRHSKIMTVDGCWTLVGSCNWDIRSFRLNFELCIECYEPEVASTLARFMESCRGGQFTLDELGNRTMPERLRDAAARLMLPYL